MDHENDEKIIYSNKKYIEKEENKPCDHIIYRGYEIYVWVDDYGQCFYSYIDDEEMSFGTYNTEYRKDIEYIIDDKLDTLYRFTEYFGAYLKYQNTYDGKEHRDLYLFYRLRPLKIWMDCKLDKADVIVEAEKILVDYLGEPEVYEKKV